MHRTAIVLLKALLVVLIGLLLLCQAVVVPATAHGLAVTFPEFAYLEVPGVIVTIVFLACVQLALVCVWRLLSLVRTSTIFSEAPFIYVNIILGAVIVATALILGSFLYLAAESVGSPSVTILCVFGIVVGAGFALMIVVMRGLLRKASQLEHDLSEVV